jgi:hypothetical protein
MKSRLLWNLAGGMLVFAASCTQGFTATGVVERTEQGKDRYMLFMKDKEGKPYRVIVSRPDMGDAYLDVQPGTTVRIEGDTVHWENEVHMKAKSLELVRPKR